jgi:hypothetical protein
MPHNFTSDRGALVRGLEPTGDRACDITLRRWRVDGDCGAPGPAAVRAGAPGAVGCRIIFCPQGVK